MSELGRPSSGTSMYMQRGNYPPFQCPYCPKMVVPFSRVQKTCGDYACSEKQRRKMADAREARRK